MTSARSRVGIRLRRETRTRSVRRDRRRGRERRLSSLLRPDRQRRCDRSSSLTSQAQPALSRSPGAEARSQSTTAPLRASAFVQSTRIGAMLTSAGERLAVKTTPMRYQGIAPVATTPGALRYFWEVRIASRLECLPEFGASDTLHTRGGVTSSWEEDGEQLAVERHKARIQGLGSAGKLGVTVAQMGRPARDPLHRRALRQNVAAIVPDDAGTCLPSVVVLRRRRLSMRRPRPRPIAQGDQRHPRQGSLRPRALAAGGRRAVPRRPARAPLRRPDPVAVQGQRRRLRGAAPGRGRPPARVPLAGPGARRPRRARRRRRPRPAPCRSAASARPPSACATCSPAPTATPGRQQLLERLLAEAGSPGKTPRGLAARRLLRPAHEALRTSAPSSGTSGTAARTASASSATTTGSTGPSSRSSPTRCSVTGSSASAPAGDEPGAEARLVGRPRRSRSKLDRDPRGRGAPRHLRPLEDARRAAARLGARPRRRRPAQHPALRDRRRPARQGQRQVGQGPRQEPRRLRAHQRPPSRRSPRSGRPGRRRAVADGGDTFLDALVERSARGCALAASRPHPRRSSGPTRRASGSRSSRCSEPHLPVVTLGPWDPAKLRGPAYWIRCIVDGTLSDDSLPRRHPGRLPARGTPGPTSARSRRPSPLKPLAELQYRGTIFAQVERSRLDDRGVPASRSSRARHRGRRRPGDPGGAAPCAAGAGGDAGRGAPACGAARAAFFDELLAPDLDRDVLRWLDDRCRVRGHLHARAARTPSGLGSPSSSASASTMARSLWPGQLGLRGGRWAKVWQRYAEAPARYPHVEERLAAARPERSSSRAPSSRASGAAGRRTTTRTRTGCAATLASLGTVGPGAAARPRRGARARARRADASLVWATLGRAPLAFAVEHLAAPGRHHPGGGRADLAGRCHAPVRGDGLGGRRCGDPCARVPAHRGRTVTAVSAAIRTVYEPWLDETARRFQEAVGRDAPMLRGRPAAGLAGRHRLIFIDGLPLRRRAAGRGGARATTAATSDSSHG